MSRPNWLGSNEQTSSWQPWSGWKLRAGVLAVSGLCALGASSAALASPGTAAEGNGNAGDVWTDNVGQPSGPGHEQDPHLQCADINLWGAGMADGSGSYTIDGWPPSGSQEQDYSSTWSYNRSKGGAQIMDVISVKTLIATAVAHGDAPVNKQGFHFKLQFSQDPQKHKTFWVNCPVPPSGGGSKTPPPSTPPSTPPASTPASTPSQPQTTSGALTPAPKPPASPKQHKHKKVVKHHKLVHPKRHATARKRAIGAITTDAPAFTG
jgi:hypothetical protein